MKVILDECLPRRLARELSRQTSHEVATVVEVGHAGLSNGQLLAAIGDEFEAFVTIDSNREYQQALGGRALRVVVVRSVSNRLEDLVPLIPAIAEALEQAGHGEVVHAG